MRPRRCFDAQNTNPTPRSRQTPLLAQHGVQRGVFAGINSIHLIIRTHEGGGVRLGQSGVKRGIVDLAQCALSHLHIDCRVARGVAQPQRFLIIGDEMFWRGNDMAALDAVDNGDADHRR